jgi:hypothetical protein
MQGHLKIHIDLFSALCPPQLHKNKKHIRDYIFWAVERATPMLMSPIFYFCDMSGFTTQKAAAASINLYLAIGQKMTWGMKIITNRVKQAGALRTFQPISPNLATHLPKLSHPSHPT